MCEGDESRSYKTDGRTRLSIRRRAVMLNRIPSNKQVPMRFHCSTRRHRKTMIIFWKPVKIHRKVPVVRFLWETSKTKTF